VALVELLVLRHPDIDDHEVALAALDAGHHVVGRDVVPGVLLEPAQELVRRALHDGLVGRREGLRRRHAGSEQRHGQCQQSLRLHRISFGPFGKVT
jgi:hypothetical protein